MGGCSTTNRTGFALDPRDAPVGLIVEGVGAHAMDGREFIRTESFMIDAVESWAWTTEGAVPAGFGLILVEIIYGEEIVLPYFGHGGEVMGLQIAV